MAAAVTNSEAERVLRKKRTLSSRAHPSTRQKTRRVLSSAPRHSQAHLSLYDCEALMTSLLERIDRTAWRCVSLVRSKTNTSVVCPSHDRCMSKRWYAVPWRTSSHKPKPLAIDTSCLIRNLKILLEEMQVGVKWEGVHKCEHNCERSSNSRRPASLRVKPCYQLPGPG